MFWAHYVHLSEIVHKEVTTRVGRSKNVLATRVLRLDANTELFLIITTLFCAHIIRLERFVR